MLSDEFLILIKGRKLCLELGLLLSEVKYVVADDSEPLGKFFLGFV